MSVFFPRLRAIVNTRLRQADTKLKEKTNEAIKL